MPLLVPQALGTGQLVSIDAPLANDTITFGYDELGRVTNRSINGAVNSHTWNYDSLGRVSSEVNKLGTFTNTYVGVTNRLSKVLNPGGSSSNYLYFPNAGQAAPADQAPEQQQQREQAIDLAVRLHL